MTKRKFYEIKDVFERFSFLNISMVAKYCGINDSLLRHYSAGTKKPSPKQLRKIQVALYEMAEEMLSISLTPIKVSNEEKLKAYLEDPIPRKPIKRALKRVD